MNIVLKSGQGLVLDRTCKSNVCLSEGRNILGNRAASVGEQKPVWARVRVDAAAGGRGSPTIASAEAR